MYVSFRSFCAQSASPYPYYKGPLSRSARRPQQNHPILFIALLSSSAQRPFRNHNPEVWTVQLPHHAQFPHSSQLQLHLIMTSAAFYCNPVLPVHRTLHSFSQLTPQNFNHPWFSIISDNLSASAINHYTGLFLSTRDTFVAPSRTGLGLYALHDIPACVPIMEYTGEIISKKRADWRATCYQREGISADYMAAVNDSVVLDATFMGNWSRYINSSCRPNVQLLSIKLSPDDYDVVWVFSLLPIVAGQHLTMRYAFCRDPEEVRLPCFCGEPNCEGWL